MLSSLVQTYHDWVCIEARLNYLALSKQWKLTTRWEMFLSNNKLTFACTEKYAKSRLRILNKSKCFLHYEEQH